MKSIKGKLIIWFTALILLSLTVVGVTSIKSAGSSIKQEAEETLMLLADEKAEFLGKEIESNHIILENIGEMEFIRSMDWDIQRDILTRQTNNTVFINMGIVDLEGIASFQDGSVDNLKDEAYIKSALNGETTLSELLYNDSTDELSLIFATPIENNGQVVGVLIGERDGYFLSEIASSIRYKEEGDGFIINGEGTNIGNPDRSMVQTRYNPFNAFENDKSLETVVEAFTTILSERKGISQYEFLGDDRYVAYSPIDGTEWILIVGASADEVLQSIPAMRNTIIIHTIIILAVSIVATYIIGNRISNPITALAVFLDQMASLDISHDVPEEFLNMSGEYGVLATSVDGIVRNLRGIIKEIGGSSQQVAATSEELTAASQQSAMASEEVAMTAEDVARGAADQAISTEEGSAKAILLGETLEEDQRHVQTYMPSPRKLQKWLMMD